MDEGAIRLSDLLRVLVREQAQRYALLNAVGFAPRLVFEACRVYGRVEREQEPLLSVNLPVALGRHGGKHRRATGVEGELACARRGFPSGGLKTGLEREGAALPRGQVGFEIVYPVARVSPAALPF